MLHYQFKSICRGPTSLIHRLDESSTFTLNKWIIRLIQKCKVKNLNNHFINAHTKIVKLIVTISVLKCI